MLVMKRITIFAILFTVVVFLAACNNTEPNVSEQKNSSTIIQEVSFPERYSNTIDGVVFDTVIETPEKMDFEKLKRSTAKMQYPDAEKVENTLGAGKELDSKEQDTASGVDGERDSFFMKYADGTTIHTGMVLNFYTEWTMKIEELFHIRTAGEVFENSGELWFGSTTEAIDNIAQSLEDVGYEVGQLNYSYYVLDHQIMQTLEPMESLKERVKTQEEWSQSDDAYYFLIEQEYQGIPVYFGDEMFPNDNQEDRPIHAIYSAEGVQQLYVPDMYSFAEKEEQQPIQLTGFSDIADVIARKYGNILTDAKYQVERAKLYQMPVRNENNHLDVKLAWLVEITESGIDSESGEAYEFTIYSHIDAETGEELML